MIAPTRGTHWLAGGASEQRGSEPGGKSASGLLLVVAAF
jgi:hypothetical protein